jgi:hypothetical protein
MHASTAWAYRCRGMAPDMKAADALAVLKAHLAKRGFGDIG